MIEPALVSVPNPIDEDLRQVLRRFAAGVTVVTSVREDGTPAGMTATAFTSVSLSPPMVLVCVDAGSRTAAAISRHGAFAVNILEASQHDLAARFASSADDKFAGLAWHPGLEGVPVLDGVLASVVCLVRSSIEAGTHRIELAEVVAAQHRDGAPLVYVDGAYRQVMVLGA